ncbi:MAG: VWA domain-containing protein [Nannocystaceae bacterium]
MSPGFDAQALERGYAFLDDCPPELIPRVVTLPIGTLAERVAGIRDWKDALLSGGIPSEPWPSGPVGESIASALGSLTMPRFSKDQAELVDELLRDIVEAVTRHHDAIESEVVRRLRELEGLERARRSDVAKHERRWSGRERVIELDDATMRRLEQAARAEVRGRPSEPEAGLIVGWTDRVRLWTEVSSVFGDLGQLLGRGWDLSLGVLRRSGWLDVLRLRALVERLPQLREIVRALGRLQESHEGPPVSERIMAPVRRLEEERRQVRTPQIPSETRGIERGDSLSRMLPAEAAMLGHPKLRTLWHARRAERALLLYNVEGLEYEPSLREVEGEEQTDGVRPRPERGPIIAVVDTSGSMHGTPEQVAKALVLEALRTALMEKRRCFVYAYSGPEQVLEHELALTDDGLGRLMEFLGMSFCGGNDETGVLLRVLARLGEEGWAKADVVFVSDGEWPVPTVALEPIERAREAGTRFTGVQIGNEGRTGLHAVCDPVHHFRDWAELGGWGTGGR